MSIEEGEIEEREIDIDTNEEDIELLDDNEIETSHIDSLESKLLQDVIRSLNKIKKNCDKYIVAHETCKNFNFKADRLVKLLMLSFSTMATYFVNTTHTEETNETIIDNNSTFSTFINGIDSDELYIDKNLTFATTIVAGVNAIFNYSNRSDIHKNMITEYIRLKNEIKLKLKTFDFSIDDDELRSEKIKKKRELINSIYEKSLNDMTNLKIRSNQIGFSNRVKKKSGLVIEINEYDY